MIGSFNPNRANISYQVTDDEEEYKTLNGESSNWISSNVQIFELKNKREYIENMDNNELIILSSSMYSRASSSTFIYWIEFILFCIISVVYPLCEYESNKGDFSFMPFGIGQFVKFMARTANMYIVSKVKQQIDSKLKSN